MRANEIAPIECAGAGPRRVIIMCAEYSEIVVWPVIATSLYIGRKRQTLATFFSLSILVNLNVCQIFVKCLANVSFGYVNESHTQPTGMRSDTTVVTVKYDFN